MTTTTRTKSPTKKAAPKRTKKAATTAKPKSKPKPKTNASRKSTSNRKGSSVDPRLKARRVEVARVEGRRRLRTLVALVIITIAAIGALALIDSSAFDVDRILVQGVVESDPATVVALTGIEAGDPLLELDLDAAARQVETMPWVASAVAHRRWNGDIRIEVVERQAIAALEVEGSDLFVLIDASGRQLAGVEARPASFVPIEGVAASGVLAQPAPAAARSAVRVIEALPARLVPSVTSVRVEAGSVNAPAAVVDPNAVDGTALPTEGEPQVLVLLLADGGRVVLGDDSSLGEKMLSLETMLTRVDTRCMEVLDLRVPSAPALTRRSVEGSLAVNDLASCSSTSTSSEG